MKHLFVPYELALLAKEKGFNEPCIAKLGMNSKAIFWCKEGTITSNELLFSEPDNALIAAPLYQQLVDWFREEHGLKICEKPTGGWSIWREVTKKQWLSDIWRATINETLEQAFKLI